MNGTIHLVRHGHVENPKNVIYGRLPGFHLSERGRRQAEAAAEYLKGRDIGAVWVSPLERAQETAAAIAAPHNVEIVTDERLIESGTTLEGIGRTFWAFLRAPKVWWQLRNPWKPTWGESFDDIRARAVAAATDALASAGGREVVVVAHQSPVQALRQGLSNLGGPPWRGGPCTTGSISTLVIEDSKVVASDYWAPPD